MQKRKDLYLIILPGIALSIIYSIIALKSNWWVEILLIIILYLTASIPYLISLFILKDKGMDAISVKKRLYLIIFFSILFRIILLPSPPSLSDDIYRYLWDGRVQSHGINPYKYPPNSDKLAFLKDEYADKVNEPTRPTIYPPLAQIVSLAGVNISYTVTFMKLIYVIFDILLIFVIYKILLFRGDNILKVIIYAWNPVAVIEFASNGHNDSMAIFFLFLSFYLAMKDRPFLSVSSLSFSVLSKYTPMILLPFYYKKIDKRAILLFPLIIIVLFWPYRNGIEELLGGIKIYSHLQKFNDSIFYILHSIFLHYLKDYYNPWHLAMIDSKMVIVVILISVFMYLFIKNKELEWSAYIIIGLFIILSFQVQPWYLMWILPFVCIYRGRAWIVLTSLIPLSYYTYVKFYSPEKIWHESLIIKSIEYFPFYFLLIYDYIKAKGKKG